MKRKNDNFARNTLISFAVVLVLLVIGVVVLNNSGDIKNSYSDFRRINDYSEVSDQDSELYGVYFYSETCGACISIKDKIMQFGSSNLLNLELFMLDANATTGDRSVINLGGDGMNSTPTLLIYKNNILVNYYVGTNEITDFYDAVKNETTNLN